MQYSDISLNQLKQYASLKQKKYRQKYNNYIVEGEKIVQELLSFNPDLCEAIIIKKGFFPEEQNFKNFEPIIVADEKSISRISNLKTPPAILAVVKQNAKLNIPSNLIQNGVYIYLFEMNDPGNLGTIIRTAEWFGLNGVILSENCVDPYNPKTIQASMGSIFRVGINQLDSIELKRKSHQFNLIGTTPDPDLSSSTEAIIDSHKGSILIIGSESHGIPNAVYPNISSWMHIPKYNPSNLPESLNAAVSAGILCFVLQQTIHK